ncbi:MAG: hypothetical protein KAT56_12120, partial [Sedimentisphaerales bacterium]|nr:hypothetical protein [Sedimentisphaerales bacterium]
TAKQACLIQVCVTVVSGLDSPKVDCDLTHNSMYDKGGRNFKLVLEINGSQFIVCWHSILHIKLSS